MLRDILSNVKIQKALSPVLASGTTDLASAAIALQDKLGQMFLVALGAAGDTLSGSLKFEFWLSECDTVGGTYTAVADEFVQGAIASGGANTGTFAVVDANAEADAVYKGAYKGHKPFVKCNVNLVGTHTNGTIVSIAAVAMPMHKPA